MLQTQEGLIADALFYSLVRLHPVTLEPTADIASHYERNPEATRYVFYLRGQPHSTAQFQPRQMERLTARDGILSWQPLYDTKTASQLAQMLPHHLNSSEILAGKLSPQDLGVRVLDNWTLEVLLAHSTDFFLTILDIFTFFAVPRQTIEADEARGAPASPATSSPDGAFRLAEWHPYEKVTVRRNQTY